MIWFLYESLIYLLQHYYIYQAMLILNTNLLNHYQRNTNFLELRQRTINSLASSKKYAMIEEFKDELRDLKNILNEIKKLEPLREQEINEIKNETKRKLNILDDEIDDILQKLDVNLTTLELRCIFWEKPHDSGKGRELRLSLKEKINEIKTLKEEAENNKIKRRWK